MMKIAVLVSGGGTNLQAILESERRGENPNGKVTLVVASKPGVYALERAANFGVETAVVRRKDYATSEEFDTALLSVKVTGATVHFVNEVCDGGPILLQKAVEVQPGDTPEVLQKRVMVEAEWKLLPQAIAMVCNGEA